MKDPKIPSREWNPAFSPVEAQALHHSHGEVRIYGTGDPVKECPVCRDQEKLKIAAENIKALETEINELNDRLDEKDKLIKKLERRIEELEDAFTYCVTQMDRAIGILKSGSGLEDGS